MTLEAWETPTGALDGTPGTDGIRTRHEVTFCTTVYNQNTLLSTFFPYLSYVSTRARAVCAKLCLSDDATLFHIFPLSFIRHFSYVDLRICPSSSCCSIELWSYDDV